MYDMYTWDTIRELAADHGVDIRCVGVLPHTQHAKYWDVVRRCGGQLDSHLSMLW
jgi:hypothetical protein